MLHKKEELTINSTGDPLTLLENPLLPSRGVNSSVYSLFNSDLGILDLAEGGINK